jgi:hypothetical protein
VVGLRDLRGRGRERGRVRLPGEGAGMRSRR